MNIETNKSYILANITQKEFDMLYAGLCCLNAGVAQKYNKDIDGYDIHELAKNLSYNASEPLWTHKNEWEG